MLFFEHLILSNPVYLYLMKICILVFNLAFGQMVVNVALTLSLSKGVSGLQERGLPRQLS